MDILTRGGHWVLTGIGVPKRGNVMVCPSHHRSHHSTSHHITSHHITSHHSHHITLGVSHHSHITSHHMTVITPTHHTWTPTSKSNTTHISHECLVEWAIEWQVQEIHTESPHFMRVERVERERGLDESSFRGRYTDVSP